MKIIAWIILILTRWRPSGRLPESKKYLLIAAPHTSNWDLIHMLSVGFAMGVRVRWIGKHTIFRFPFGCFMRLLGGISIDRRARHDYVKNLVKYIDKQEKIAIVVAPEGTRNEVQYWKSGFYHIAVAAGLHLVMGFLDYGRKVGGIGPTIKPTGDIRLDMAKLRDFYNDIIPCYPEKYTPPKLREEESTEYKEP